MKFNKVAIFCGSVMAFGGVMQGSTIDNYAFGGLGNLYSATHTFSPVGGSGPTITATGYDNTRDALTTTTLFSKGNSSFPISSDESGLGLKNDRSGDNEITQNSFIMLDLGNLEKFHISSLGIYTESTTGREQWTIWGSQTAPKSGLSYSFPTAGSISGKSEGDQNVTSLENDRYIFITATSGNILLGGLTAVDPVPEPASAGLLGLALLSSGIMLRKRFAKKVV